MKNRKITGRPKGSKNKAPLVRETRRIRVGTQVYTNASVASVELNVPRPTVWHRCKVGYKDWSYE